MWKLLIVLALPLVPLAATHDGNPETPVKTTATADVECLIRAKPVTGGVELEGVVASRTPMSGTYEFDVRKAGGGGTSNSVQSGDFEAQTGEQVIGHVGLGLEHGATYDATLVVRWNSHEISCEATGPDRA